MSNPNPISPNLTRGIHLLSIALVLVGLFAVAQPTQADAIIVTTPLDNVAGCLRYAIDTANTTPGPDTITFHPDTNGIFITLTGSSGDDVNLSGDLDILSNGDLEIQGNGPTNTIISGDANDRVFHICPDEGCSSTITFTGVTIRDGFTGGGGGILNMAGTTTLTNTTVTYNTANYGGGIFNQGTLNLQGSTTIVDHNIAIFDGGGIVNLGGTTTVISATISGNNADEGGGIYNGNGTTILDNSTVSGNTAGDGNGGGIYNDDSTLIIQNGSTIGESGAPNQASTFGGGIYNESGTTTIKASSVISNTAVNGAGIYNEATLNIIQGSTIGGMTEWPKVAVLKTAAPIP